MKKKDIRPRGQRVVDLVLLISTFVALVAGIVHCLILLITDGQAAAVQTFPSTSFPYWSTAALVAIPYAFLVVFLFAAWLIHRIVTVRSAKKREEDGE